MSALPDIEPTRVAKSTQCLNFRADLAGPFCARCGQRDIPPYPSVRELAVDAFWELSGWDGRSASTVRTLVRRPGLLTRLLDTRVSKCVRRLDRAHAREGGRDRRDLRRDVPPRFHSHDLLGVAARLTQRAGAAGSCAAMRRSDSPSGIAPSSHGCQ